MMLADSRNADSLALYSLTVQVCLLIELLMFSVVVYSARVGNGMFSRVELTSDIMRIA